MACDPGGLPAPVVGALQSDRLTPLVGSRVSQLSDPSIPTWAQFLDRLRGHPKVLLPEQESERMEVFLDKGKFRRAASVMMKHVPTEVYLQVFDESFGARRTPHHVHRALVDVGAPLMMTTNYDALLETAHVLEMGTAPKVVTHRSATMLSQRSGPTIFKAFGSAEDPFSIVFDEVSFSEARRELYSQLGDLFSGRTVVVAMGYTADDPAARSLFDMVPEIYGDHYAVFGSQEEADRWSDEYPLQAIVCAAESPVEDFLAQLAAS